MEKDFNSSDLFEKLRESVLKMDPIYFCEKYLTLEGRPFTLTGNGYKPFMDIYRYIGIKALERNSKPIVLVKGRQVGATTMCSALEMYFMGCGLFGVNGNPPMRVIHAFPKLDLAFAYTKTKLNPMISGSVVIDSSKNLKKPRSYMQNLLDKDSQSNDSMQFKQFVNGNHLWIESTGVNGDRLRGRQLALDTELPTPNGFVKLIDVKEGDELFDENGNVCKVTKLHPINYSPEAYELTFDDGTIVEACSDHLWLTYTKADRLNKNISRKPKIKNTKEIYNSLNYKNKPNHSIPICKPINYSKKELLIDPYLFGLYFGAKDLIHNIVEKVDFEIINYINNIKYIPKNYIQGSFKQRLALLQGLMDSNGYCYKNNRCEFIQVNKDIADQVLELITSLGMKATVKNNQNKYDVIFFTNLPVFRIQEKLNNIKKYKSNFKINHRFIKSIKRIESKPMRCLTVDSKSHLFLITRSFIPTHNTADVILFDEVQDMFAEALNNSTKILSKAAYGIQGDGVQVYFGTPKQKGSTYYDIWTNSSQQYYYLGCLNCGKHFPLYTPGSDEWESIWLYEYIVRCTHCGHEQDKRKSTEIGKWMPSRDPNESDFIGFHINQLYNPEFTKEKILKEKPGKNPMASERSYQNEVLGEFYSGDAGIITLEEIREKCADHGRKMAASLSSDETQGNFLGIDWGARSAAEQHLDESKIKIQGQSYTVPVVLSVLGPNKFSVQFATMLKKNDFQNKKNMVDTIMRKYSIKLAVGDIGYANDICEVLQNEYGEKFIPSRAMGRLNDRIKYVDTVYPKEIQFDRDSHIAELFQLMKDGAIKFPFGNWEQISWLIDHCTYMEIKASLSRGGQINTTYVKSLGPNDGFMALLNAYLAYKYYVSNGFKIKNKFLYNKVEDSGKVPMLLGNCPRL